MSTDLAPSHSGVGCGFRFGQNWARFLPAVDDAAVAVAQQSLCDLLGETSLRGRSFLDVGSGSGLSSRAACELGARVHSLDIDADCVRCTTSLRNRSTRQGEWIVQSGSALDREFLTGLGTFDVVYSWGVLHHTGNMWAAIDNVAARVAHGGRLVLAIYNDQGGASRRWTRVKRLYNRTPRMMRWMVLIPALLRIWGPTMVRDLLRLRPGATWRSYSRVNRGMRPWRDLVDWVGGYPFEVAKPEAVIDRCHRLGFQLRQLKTCGGGRGCNEFVFEKRTT